MAIQTGFSIEELPDHPQIDKIQTRMESVVQIRFQKGEKDIALGTGFFLLQDPPILVTANHVLEDTNVIDYAYLRFNYDRAPYTGDPFELVDKRKKIKIIFNEIIDCSMLLFLDDFDVNFSAIFPTVDSLREGVVHARNFLELYSGFYEGENPQLGLIHHPADESKKIATEHETFTVILGRLRTVYDFLNDEQETWEKFFQQAKYGRYFVYWARDTDDPFVRCTLPLSSGAPVFDKKWHLIGLHQQGSFENPKKVSFFSIGIPFPFIMMDTVQQLSKLF